jgi:hypothetical protein
MKMMMAGMSGWARFENTEKPAVKLVDMAITVVGTVLLAVTYVLVRG